MRLRFRLAAATVLAGLLAGLVGSQARAAFPMVRWHGERWDSFLLYNMNPAHPNPKVGRLLGRTTALDRSAVPPPLGFKRWPVNVYTLPKIDRHVAVYVTGGHIHRELLVRRAWRVRPGSPLARVMNYTGKVVP